MALISLNQNFMSEFGKNLKNNESAIRTGLVDLDYAIGGGLKKGALYVIGGRPSMGKTS